MQAVIRQAVQNCSACQQCKPNQARQPMTSYPLPDHPWSIVSADMFSLYGTSYLLWLTWLVVPGTVSESLNGWSEALTVGLAVKTAKPLS